MLVIAFASATLREGLLTPRIGAMAAHWVGTILVGALLILAIALSVRWIVPSLDPGRLFGLGIGWTALTMAFEFGFGRFIMGYPWSRLLHDYNLLAGRIWIMVLLTTLLGPCVIGRMRA